VSDLDKTKRSFSEMGRALRQAGVHYSAAMNQFAASIVPGMKQAQEQAMALQRARAEGHQLGLSEVETEVIIEAHMRRHREEARYLQRVDEMNWGAVRRDMIEAATGRKAAS
jgi:hypothetical protein